MTFEDRQRIKAAINRSRRDALAHGARVYVEIAQTLPAGILHGTNNAYNNYYCRCDPCRASEAARRAARRAREKLEAAA